MREAVYINEEKRKIEKIKAKYNNMNLDDNTAKKINNLEITNNILKSATIIAGIATIINYFIPDPIPLMDEAVMTGLTGLLKTSSTIVENKIDKLAKTGNAKIKIEEIETLTKQIKKIANEINNQKIKMKY